MLVWQCPRPHKHVTAARVHQDGGENRNYCMCVSVW